VVQSIGMKDRRPSEALAPELVREFVIAGHGNLPRVKEMLAEYPGLLHAANAWAPGDRETAIQAAAHAGSAHVAEYLLAQGAPLEIFTAASLGRREAVEGMLADDPALIRARGAHGIPLLAHAAFSGDVGLVAMLVERGGTEGASMALSNSVGKGHLALTRWLLDHTAPDLNWKNYQGKTALEVAAAAGREEITTLLRARGAAGTEVAREA
jgi:ankyrin repeat protein